jgi:F-type H+-transporting ATPase subunit a
MQLMFASVHPGEHAAAIQDTLQQAGAAATHADEYGAALDPLGHVINRDLWEVTHALKWNLAELLPLPSFKIGSLTIDLAPSLHVVMLWLAAIVLTLLVARAARQTDRDGLVPRGRLRNFFEAIIVFLRDEVVYNIMGPRVGRRYMPLLLTFFFFILFNNLLGLVPIPSYFHAGTSNLNVTAMLAVVVFLVVQVVAVKQHGPKYYIGLLFPKTAPGWLRFTLMPFIEVIGVFARPFSLAIRLFANMTAGHQIIVVLLTGELIGVTYLLRQGFFMKILAPLPLLGVIVMGGFEIFVAFIQAFIFALLTALYLGEALEESH